MVAHVLTVALNGLTLKEVDVQVQISSGLPAFNIVGLADKTVAESKERIRASLNALGFSFPPERITVNLAPADLQKEGSHFDLPITLALLTALKVLPQQALKNFIVMGEMGLDGSILKVSGILPTALRAAEKKLGLICPEKCGGEAAWGGSKNILAAASLPDLLAHFKGELKLSAPLKKSFLEQTTDLDYAHVKGQETAKRVLEIAAAGGHNVLMIGPPGSGKTMLAERLPSILPPLSPKEALEVSMIYSIKGLLKEEGLISKRPFRAPHHAATLPALIGGGLKARPGEISLAHHGVLFLDELPEFSKNTLEALREPLEKKEVLLARANYTLSYPANFQLIAAMNPCRCGHLQDISKRCTRAPLCAEEYTKKISGPLLDRFDLILQVSKVNVENLSETSSSLTSEEMRSHVIFARSQQLLRKLNKYNANLTVEEVDKILLPQVKDISFLNTAAQKLCLSARGFHRVLKVSRTIADLEGTKEITRHHLSEALSYR